MQQKINNKKVNLLFVTFFIIIIVVILLFVLNSCTVPTKQSKSLPFYDSQKGNTYLYYNHHNNKMTKKQINNAQNGYNLFIRHNGKMYKRNR
jgi:hypothetical protein